jgi:hypothetical protein
MPDSIDKTGTYVATFDHDNGELSTLRIWAFYKYQNTFVTNNVKLNFSDAIILHLFPQSADWTHGLQQGILMSVCISKADPNYL